MSGRVTLKLTMTLLSDTIFGSGFSIPGGEDIAVCQDKNGYPYLKGTTLKGLLREGLENIIAWTSGAQETVDLLLGGEGWMGTVDAERRIQLTALTLVEPPEEAAACYCDRAFTALENGVVKTGALRMASCIRRGSRFTGELVCSQVDTELVQDALASVKWAGTMRSRGFGRVRIQWERMEEKTNGIPVEAGCCIRYRLRLEMPVLSTNLGRSQGNSYETRGFIQGSAIRGMVIGRLAAENPVWFQANKVALLSDGTRFLNALPSPAGQCAIPSIMGFYEDKQEEHFETVVKDGDFTPGFKRAKLGSFCALEGDCVRYWSAETGGVTRIQRNTGTDEDSRPFRTRYLSAGQELEGYILLDDAALAPEIGNAFGDTVWLGADRYEGFGKCTVTELEITDTPAWTNAYGYHTQEEVGERLYLLALSPLTMLGERGEPCGIDEVALAEKLGVEKAEIRYCSTAMSEYSAFNRTWGCYAPSVRMYDQGSIFQIQCSCPPKLEGLLAIQREGLGIRRGEGYGQVLVLRTDLFEGLCRKKAMKPAESRKAKTAASVRRARYRWIMEHGVALRQDGLSKSQLGGIQTLCEKSMTKDGSLAELYEYLNKNMNERGAKHGARFRQIDKLIREVIETPLAKTIGVESCEDSAVKRLELLCQLFNYSRKAVEEV